MESEHTEINELIKIESIRNDVHASIERSILFYLFIEHIKSKEDKLEILSKLFSNVKSTFMKERTISIAQKQISSYAETLPEKSEDDTKKIVDEYIEAFKEVLLKSLGVGNA